MTVDDIDESIIREIFEFIGLGNNKKLKEKKGEKIMGVEEERRGLRSAAASHVSKPSHIPNPGSID